jgi:hypothetical protein
LARRRRKRGGEEGLDKGPQNGQMTLSMRQGWKFVTTYKELPLKERGSYYIKSCKHHMQYLVIHVCSKSKIYSPLCRLKINHMREITKYAIILGSMDCMV